MKFGVYLCYFSKKELAKRKMTYYRFFMIDQVLNNIIKKVVKKNLHL